MSETQHHEEVEHGRAWWIWVLVGIGVIGTLAVLAAVYVTVTGTSAENERDESVQERVESEQDKAAIAAPANESASTILELCEKDNRVAKVLRRKGVCDASAQVRKEIRIQVLEGPEGPEGAEGPRGKQGPGPTEAQVLLAVQQHCQAQPGGSCEGPGPTRAEVRAAVSAFCADGRCRGAQGATGDTGAQGKQGPGPSEAQIDAAVDSYCDADGDGAVDRCRGPKGEQGAKGDPCDPDADPDCRGPRGYQVTEVKFETYGENDEKCRVVFTLNDPKATQIATEVPRSFCASTDGDGNGPP